MTSRWGKSIGHEIYPLRPSTAREGKASLQSPGAGPHVSRCPFTGRADVSPRPERVTDQRRCRRVPHGGDIVRQAHGAGSAADDDCRVPVGFPEGPLSVGRCKEVAPLPLAAEAGYAVLEKARDRGRQTLEATLASKVAL